MEQTVLTVFLCVWGERVGGQPRWWLAFFFSLAFCSVLLLCLWSLNSQLSYLNGSKWRRALEVGKDARRCPDGQDRLRIYLIRMPFKIYLLFSVEMGYYICLLGGVKEWVSVCVCVCVCACDGFTGLVGSERRKLMEFSTSKQSLPSNQFNKARLKPTHIHQFWLDRHCDPDACSDGLPKRAEVTSHLFSRVVLVHSHVMGFSWSRHMF